MELQELIDWAAVEPMDRSVHFKIERGEVSCWVYAYRIGEGQFIKEISEIDLESKKAAKERAKYQELKQKYEPQEIAA